jgi:hypothetical protein
MIEYRRLAPDASVQKIKLGNSMIHLSPRLFDGLRQAGLPEV